MAMNKREPTQEELTARWECGLDLLARIFVEHMDKEDQRPAASDTKPVRRTKKKEVRAVRNERL